MSTSLVAPEQLEAEEPEIEETGEDWRQEDGFPNLPEEKQNVLKGLLRSALTREVYSRRTEVIDARQQRFYSRSIQYIYWNWNTMMFAPLYQGGTGTAADQERYCDVYDIYSAFLRTLTAALSQNDVGAHMVPRTAKRTVDITAATVAEQYKSRLEQINDIKNLQIEVARLMCTDGRVVGMVCDEDADPQYGYDANNEPMGAERLEIDGVLEWKVPITQKNLCDWPYAVQSREFETEYLEECYPEAVDDQGESKIKSGSQDSGESAYERMARIGVVQGTKVITATGETWEHLTTRHIAFLRPAFYKKAPKDQREWLKETYPDGIKLIVCGGVYCKSWNASMDKWIRVGHAKPGDGQNRTSLLKAFVPIQDAFNDLMNLRKEMHEYCIPENYMDKDTYDLQAQQEHVSEPGNTLPVVLQPNEDIRNKILFGQPVQISPDLIRAIEYLSGELAQLITAALPSLMGSGDEHNETKGGIQIMREQALGQMGIAWGASQWLLAHLEELAIKRCGEKAKDKGTKMAIKVPGTALQPDSVREIDTQDLNAGDFYAEVDVSFPDTRAAKRAILMSMISFADKVPSLQGILSLPENQELLKENTDTDLEIPGADARIQQLREIEQLLQSGPNVPTPQQALAAMAQKVQQAMAQGMPEPPPPTPQVIKQVQQAMAQPTVPIDPEWDFHQFHIQVIQDWLASDQCNQEKEKGNLAGIENVKLHGKLHKQALQAQQGAPQGKPPSVSINYKDLTPGGKMQAAAEAGIQEAPAEVAAAEMQDQKPQGAPVNARA